MQGPWGQWAHGVWAEDPVKANAAERKRVIPQEVVGISTCLPLTAFRTLPERVAYPRWCVPPVL